MPSPIPEHPLASWYTKPEVQKILHRSERVIDRYANEGRIEKRMRPVFGRRDEPVYNPDDVGRVRDDRPVVVREPRPQINDREPQNNDRTRSLTQQGDQSIAQETAQNIAQHVATISQFIALLLRAGLAQSLLPPEIAAAEPQQPSVPSPLWVSLSDASLLTGLSEGRLRRFVKEGKLGAVRQKGGMKICRAELETLRASDWAPQKAAKPGPKVVGKAASA